MRSRVIVLKFGGSVLADEGALRQAVHEVYRWHRQGYRVAAVVSALAGATDRRLAACEAYGTNPDPACVATRIAGGELECAALLGLQLDRAGVPARVLAPGALGLTAVGDPLDASPVELDTSPVLAAFRQGEVVVLPGFVAQDPEGRTVVLGRGGSDLSALFLASRLPAARCRLIKDVDGLYERDPAAPGPRPRRYDRMTFEDALATDGSILQHKAVRFARTIGRSFEVGRWNGVRPTLVGHGPTHFSARADTPRPLDVALLGLGTVGGGTLELLRELPGQFRVGTAAVSRLGGDRDGLGIELSTDAEAVARSGADVVVEALGGFATARDSGSESGSGPG